MYCTLSPASTAESQEFLDSLVYTSSPNSLWNRHQWTSSCRNIQCCGPQYPSSNQHKDGPLLVIDRQENNLWSHICPEKKMKNTWLFVCNQTSLWGRSRNQSLQVGGDRLDRLWELCAAAQGHRGVPSVESSDWSWKVAPQIIACLNSTIVPVTHHDTNLKFLLEIEPLASVHPSQKKRWCFTLNQSCHVFPGWSDQTSHN